MRSIESVTMLIPDPKSNDGEEIEINVDGYVHYHVERNWGADSDGHRGIKKIFVDDVKDVEAYDLDGADVELTEAQKEEAIELLGNKFLEG